jgi:spore germination cell wall hydrolase CwlJ-like protein
MSFTRRKLISSVGLGGVGLALSPLEIFAGEAKRNPYAVEDFSRDSDRVLLGRMVWGEARNCAREERVAVAYSVVNRFDDERKRFGKRIREVLLKKSQYSCFNEGNVNRRKLLDPERFGKKEFYECLRVAWRVLIKREKDPAHGATHFFNLDKVEKPPKFLTSLIKIGKIKTSRGLSTHDFYLEV